LHRNEIKLSTQEVRFTPKTKAPIPDSIMVAPQGLKDFICYDADDDNTIVDNPPIKVKPSPEIASKRQRTKTIPQQEKPLLSPKEYRKIQATIKPNDMPIEYALATFPRSDSNASGLSEASSFFNFAPAQKQEAADSLKM